MTKKQAHLKSEQALLDAIAGQEGLLRTFGAKGEIKAVKDSTLRVFLNGVETVKASGGAGGSGYIEIGEQTILLDL